MLFSFHLFNILHQPYQLLVVVRLGYFVTTYDFLLLDIMIERNYEKNYYKFQKLLFYYRIENKCQDYKVKNTIKNGLNVKLIVIVFFRMTEERQVDVIFQYNFDIWYASDILQWHSFGKILYQSVCSWKFSVNRELRDESVSHFLTVITEAANSFGFMANCVRYYNGMATNNIESNFRAHTSWK